jgi:hypothetical protein
VEWWRAPLRALVRGRRVILVGFAAAGWTATVAALRTLDVADLLVVGTEGRGAGPQPDARTVVAQVPDAVSGTMERLRHALALMVAPPPHVAAAVEEFDPDGSAVVFGHFLTESPDFLGRPLVAHRRPEWVALEDKTTVDALLDRAGVPRAPSAVVAVAQAAHVCGALDAGAGTVWSADARDGYHGGGVGTRWVVDDREARAATAELARICDRVRVMPFLPGIATSIHGIVLPDGVAALRPVELVMLRHGHELVYGGCATFWDPPAGMRAQMRQAARRVGALLAAEVGFRGAFTLDGVATGDGFRPTELNPRFGGGLGVLTRSLDIPLNLVLDLAVAGRRFDASVEEIEREIVADADRHRSGGSWQLTRTPVIETSRDACYGPDGWRWAAEGETGDGVADAAGHFARIDFRSDRTPVGPSVGRRSVEFWRFAAAELGVPNNDLTAAPDVTRDA